MVASEQALNTHRVMGDSSRFRIIEELQRRGSLDSRQLGVLIGLHPNTIRSHVDRLLAAGLVRSSTSRVGGRGRPRVLYEATADFTPVEERSYRLLAEVLAGQLAATPQPQKAAEIAGRSWGSRLVQEPRHSGGISADQATQEVVDLFAELGFIPERRDEAGTRTVLLHRCPFREVAEANSQVVCAVHLGMLRGALAEMGAPLEATRLDPFVEPHLCVAHLRSVPRRDSVDGVRNTPSAT